MESSVNFGEALEALKQGQKVARSGWNSKGMWLKLVHNHEFPIFLADFYETLPWIGMKTADDKFVPWLASQTDMLAEDWNIV